MYIDTYIQTIHTYMYMYMYMHMCTYIYRYICMYVLGSAHVWRTGVCVRPCGCEECAGVALRARLRQPQQQTKDLHLTL